MSACSLVSGQKENCFVERAFQVVAGASLASGAFVATDYVASSFVPCGFKADFIGCGVHTIAIAALAFTIFSVIRLLQDLRFEEGGLAKKLGLISVGTLLSASAGAVSQIFWEMAPCFDSICWGFSKKSLTYAAITNFACYFFSLMAFSGLAFTVYAASQIGKRLIKSQGDQT